MNKIYGVCFSPAGKTEIIVKTIINKLNELTGTESIYISITTPEDREVLPCFEKNDVVIIGTPTYAGRVPNKIMPFISETIKGNGATGAAVVTYGNRAFDDSLIELVTIMKSNGFRVTGSGAFVAEHSFAEKLATGRPGTEDLKKAEVFAQGIRDKYVNNNFKEPETPGNKDYDSYYIPKGTDGKPAKFLKAKPVTDWEKCTGCGKCAQVCPMGSISGDDYEVNGICIKCQACIRICPEKAKRFEDPAFLSHKAMLEKNFAEVEKESEIYL